MNIESIFNEQTFGILKINLLTGVCNKFILLLFYLDYLHSHKKVISVYKFLLVNVLISE